MGNSVNIILGTMTFGPQVNEATAEIMVNSFLDDGHHEIDTAYVYNDGVSEEILGNVLKNKSTDKYSIATKVNPRVTGKLDAQAINRQLAESLDRLSRKSVDILYLHFPDPNTPLETTLKACADLYEKGMFKELGLSNFPAWLVVDVWHICRKNRWPIPTVYQGMYNGLSRKTEDELFPALKQFGLRFYAYNPLAGGILTGKYKNFEEDPSPGRFTYRPNYRERYWKKSFFDAMNNLVSICETGEIALAEAAYRWLAYHSKLNGDNGDGIIIGASSVNQLQQNLNSIKKGPLPDHTVAGFNKAWEETKSDSPDYFRFFTK